MATYDIKRMYEWPKGIRLSIIICAGMIIFYLGYLLDISSLNATLKISQQQEADMKEQYQMIIHKKVTLQNDVSHYPELKSLLTRWQKHLVTHAEIPELLNDILKTGGNNHLYFNLFNPLDDVRESIYYKLPIKMVVVGRYQEISNFISQIANLPQIVMVDDFTLSNENRNDVLGAKLAKQAADQNLLTAEITLLVYRVAEKKTP